MRTSSWRTPSRWPTIPPTSVSGSARTPNAFPTNPSSGNETPKGVWRGPTYAEALARVNRLSTGLLALGLDGSRPIAILSENSVEMALVQLAAMQVGIAVAPISYAYSALSKTGGHIKHILDVIAAPLVVMSDADLHMAKLDQWEPPRLAPLRRLHMPTTTTACSRSPRWKPANGATP